MTWAEFVTEVNEQLSVDADRRGLEDFRLQQMKNAAIDLQRNIESYRRRQVTIFNEFDTIVVGKAQLISLPKFSIPTAFYVYSTKPGDDPNIQRNRLDAVNWLNRYSLQTGVLGTRAYRYSLSPAGDEVMVYPPITNTGQTALLMTWNGFKRDYADDDIITMPEEASEAVALYVKKAIARRIDKDISMAREYERDYVTKRLALFRDAQERHDADKPDDEFPEGLPVIIDSHLAFSDGFSLGFL